MEEILASIRRIIADDDASKAEAPAPAPAKPAQAAPPPPPRPAPAAPTPAPSASNSQDDIDALFAKMDAGEEAPAPEPQPEPEPADILELTEAMKAPPPAFRTIDGDPDVVFNEPAPEPEPVPPPRAAPPRVAPPRPAPRPPTQEDASWPEAAQGADERPLLSAATSAVVDSAFNALAQTVLVQNARTLEDLVREMLRPMLKAWLDDNLPHMVERLVRAEIERVSRGRG